MRLSALDLYRIATSFAAPPVAIFLAVRRVRGKEEKSARFEERFGRPSRPRPAGSLVWLHAASVGEAHSALPLVNRLLALVPRASMLVTTGTVTSARLMAERLPPRAFHQYVPVDHPAWVGRFLDHWQPDLALWVESELWPNLVLETSARGVAMALVNARMSDRSFAGWRRWPRIIGPLLRCFRRVLAQSEADAARFIALGARNVVITGSLKYDAEPLPADASELGLLENAIGDRPRWLAASTHAGEEFQVAQAHRQLKARYPNLLTLLVPRHIGRGDGIAAELRKLGLRVSRRSRGETPDPATEVYIADTMGELGLFYRLAPVVFMGGSLVPHGGQNLLEPARLGCALLYGPYMHNFRPVVANLAAAGAAEEVRDAASLADAVSELLRNEPFRAQRCAAAKRVTEAGRGVLEKAMAALAPELADLAGAQEAASVARA